MENTVCESAQTDDCSGNHPRSTPSRCFAQRSSRARGLLRGWIQTALKNWVSPKKSHQRSQSTGCVLVRKAPTTPHSQATAPQAKDRGGLQGRPRWGSRQLTEAECQYPVHLARLRGRVGDLSLFALLRPSGSHTHPTMISHTRPMDGHRRRQRLYPLWWCSTTRSVRRNHFSRRNGYSDGKPTPALQHLEPGRLLLGE